MKGPKSPQRRSATRFSLDFKKEVIDEAIFYVTQLKNTLITSQSVTQMLSDKPRVSVSLELNNENTIRQTEARLFVRPDIFTPVPGIPS